MGRLFIAVSLFLISITSYSQQYIFYLHGKIVEDQGENAFDKINGYGAYEYKTIVDAFKKKKFKVISEVRARNTDPKEYSKKVVKQVDSLINKGINPGSITVVGASKGSMIAMLVSSYLKNKKVNFVFMAACNDYTLNQFPDITFYGNILSIYERSDEIGKTCASFKEKSPGSIGRYKEIELNTGLKHGFIFRPLAEWMNPTVEWANEK